MNLDELLASGQSEVAAVKSAAELETFRIKYLGAKGLCKVAAEHLRTLPGPEKRGYGQRMNEVNKAIEAAFEEKKAGLDSGPKVVTGIDVTEPGRLAFEKYQPGSLHIITQTINELTSLFARMGFAVAEGPEVEDDFHNFEALNIPKVHPARDPLDNFYLDIYIYISIYIYIYRRAKGAAPVHAAVADELGADSRDGDAEAADSDRRTRARLSAGHGGCHAPVSVPPTGGAGRR